MIRKSLSLITLVFIVTTASAEDAAHQEGKQIFEQRCADICHQTPEVGLLNAKQWRVVLNTMQKRMRAAGMPPLTQEELQQVLNYLTDGQ